VVTSPDVHLVRVVKIKLKSLKEMRTGKERKLVIENVHEGNQSNTRHRRFRIKRKSLAIFTLKGEKIAKL